MELRSWDTLYCVCGVGRVVTHEILVTTLGLKMDFHILDLTLGDLGLSWTLDFLVNK